MKQVLLLITAALFLMSVAPMRQKPLVDIDFGGSVGSYNGKSYSELNLGLNLNFTDWLTWRNAGFKRFSSLGDKDITGLDSTLRLIDTTPFDGGGFFRMFAGAGYRFADPSDKNAALAEAGLGVNFGRFGIGAGAKYLKYDKAQYDSAGLETKREDLIYSIILSGGAGIGF